jgi:hypothetical protein
MKVRCISNTGWNLPEKYTDPRAGIVRDTEFRLTIGKEYVVYALALREAQVWYYVCDDAGLWYPVHHPAPLFDVVDDRLSEYWRYTFSPGHADHLGLFAFEEWGATDYFYDRLTDRVGREAEVFQRVKEAMDAETLQEG